MSRFLSAVGALVLLGCPAAVCPVQRFDTAAAALEAHAAMRAPARVIRAEATVDRRDSEGRIRGTVLMFLERPDRVRFDAMTQLGPAAVLTSDGTTFALTDLREERFYVGPTCSSNIERLLGLPLEGSEVTQILLGQTPRIEGEQTIQCQAGTYRATIRAADGRTQTLDLEVPQDETQRAPAEQRTRLRRTEVRAAGGALEWRVEWDGYQVVEGGGASIALPFRIHFEHPARGIDTLLRFESIDLNVEVPADAFVQEPRPGLPIETVECHGASG